VDKIDKSIPTPLYYQLLQILEEKIANGTWKPGDTIPTELEIMQQYGISRSTVRQAILALVNMGYLRREKSKGTIVKSPTGRVRFVGSLISFSEEMRRKGISHSSRILDQRIIPADAHIAGKLNLQVGDEVYFLRRVRYLGDSPFLIDVHYIPHALCPGIDSRYKENTSLYDLLRTEYKFNLHHGQIEFEAVSPPSKEVIDLLEVYSTTSLIMAERIVYSEKETPLDYFNAIIHGKFSIDIMVNDSQ
jgi:GntR family transcriptional regulator